ncbi:hypothetical protein FZC84_06905 [Rossellomorea vietnamensis]|uniref:DUF4878 domain-containing protein n=1 Tax=Rossellomorea vietnamensis TaxID=218284 RepID=A0A5D4MFB4_9BACI|nr:MULTISPECIES: hypothetical protein [Bacillaceae]TYS00267.1 hypothetical protein FZC84_06905 [Rossellomorea vietnamensis]
MKKVFYGIGIAGLLLAGCGTAEESTEADPSEAQAVKDTQQETYETASSDDSTNGNTEDGPEMTKEKAEEVLKKYEETFMEVIEKGPELEEYESKDEIIQQFSMIMTEGQAKSLADIYIKNSDGDLSVVATEAPIWLKYEQEYSVHESSEEEYRVVQNISSQLRGNLEVTYVLVKENGSWVVSKTKTANIEQEESDNGEKEEFNQDRNEVRTEGDMDFK